jgi:lysozyme family protein
MKAITFTLKLEVGVDKDGRLREDGGYNNLEADPGGETKWGISKRAHPDVDIKNLSLADAMNIYKEKYYDVYKKYNIDLDSEEPGFAIAIFDSGVNCGVGNARRWYEIAKTANDPVNKLLSLRKDYYGSLKTFNTFGKGWLARVNMLSKYCAIVSADSSDLG